MQQKILKAFFFSVSLLASNIATQAQNSWAMAMIEEGENLPSFKEFRCKSETGANGIDYLRIYDYSYRIRKELFDNPEKLKYGYRIADKQIFIYDFETEEERLAFDFTLSAGDRFKTYNGTEWKIETVSDTLVNTSYIGKGESCTKLLMKVHSVDGRYSDEWLEDFGSFSNHLMILPINGVVQTQTLWMEYDFGHYLVREISSDPLYTHDSGMPERTDDPVESYCCTYSDGTLKLELNGYHSPNREYICFCRVGDGFYWAYKWDLNPATEAAYVVWYKDVAFFTNFPEPQSGKYTIRSSDEYTGIKELTSDKSNNLLESPVYDLNGRKHTAPAKDVFIHWGQKFFVK
ncbi:MAG: hypothetical protein IKS24_10510 [Bacteroidaceae bacterium]|nr:hypothetical protein [Bacteroidaceae bacterium]